MPAGPARTRVSLRMGAQVVDVVIPAGASLAEALRAADMEPDAPTRSVVSSTGAPVDLYSTSGDGFVDGEVLHVLDGGRLRAGGRSGAGAAGGQARGAALARPTTTPWWLGVAGAAAVVLASTVALEAADRTAESAGRDRDVLAALLVGAGLALAVARRRPGEVGAGWPAVVAALAGFAGGAVSVDPALPGAGQLMMMVGFVASTVVSATGWAVTRRHGSPAADLPGVLVVVGGVAAATSAAALLAGLPGAFAAAVLLGMVPLGLRVLPAACIDVPVEQLVDVGQVARTVAVVRGVTPEPLGQVNDRRVVRSVRSAERRRDAGTVALCLVGPVAAPVVLVDAQPGTVTGWAAVVTVVFVAAVLALAPRTTRGAPLRWVPRVCAAALLLELGVLVLVPQTGGTLLAVAAAIAAGLLIAAVSLPLGRGWRSVGLSRLADTLESLATVLALPAALAAGGAIELFRQVTSG